MNFDIEVVGRMIVMAFLLTLMVRWNHTLWGWICWVAVGIVLFKWVEKASKSKRKSQK